VTSKYVAFGILVLACAWIVGILTSLVGVCISQVVLYLVSDSYDTISLSIVLWTSFLVPITLAAYYTGEGVSKLCR
jgi:hypothetical protein